MSTVNEIAERHVTRFAAIDPVTATSIGITGHDDQMTDLSPDGFAARNDLDRDSIAALHQATVTDHRSQAARDGMLERLTVSTELYSSGETESSLNVIASWPQSLRSVFDLMPVEGEQAWHNLASRMSAMPWAFDGLRQTYLRLAERGYVAPRRQIAEVAKQCAEWSAPGKDFFSGLVRRTQANGSIRAELDRAAVTASAATAQFGRFLESELLPLAPDRDAVGRERYELASRVFLGATIDLDDAYAWGWAELLRIEAEMRRVAAQIVPDGTVADAVAALDADPARRIAGRERLRSWMQDKADQTITEMNGVHFDIPEPARRIECVIAPTSDGGIYYTGPSEDWSRPGQMWWAVPDGVNEFSTWKEVTTIYHEGVPGHHLQIAQTVFLAEQLNRWQRLMCWVSGHGEGWALYAERLMDDLGYLADPGDKLGMLDAQLLRAARVVVDMGIHLELAIPADSSWHPGEVWNADLAWEFLRSRVHVGEQMLRFEWNRYLGWAGQASSYKLGERIWLSARDEVRQRQGAGFDLKRFHSHALELGSIGLDPLREALARL